jgi:hypothetical protein
VMASPSPFRRCPSKVLLETIKFEFNVCRLTYAKALAGTTKDNQIDVPLTSYLIDLDVCFATRAKITRVTNIFKLRPKKS